MPCWRWKSRLSEHGWLINTEHEHLTNTRYADDCLLYAKRLPESVDVLGHLHDELSAVGLEMHENKTKVLTSSFGTPNHISVRGLTVEVLSPEQSHRYLGRRLCLDRSCRVSVEVGSRLSAAWAKFNAHRRWFVDKRISLKLRMRFLRHVSNRLPFLVCTSCRYALLI